MDDGLSIQNVDVKRGELTVVRDVSISCKPGQVTVLLGSNGAGKSTLLDAISGVIPVDRGTVELDGAPIHKLSRDRRASRGLAYVEQGRSIFAGLTVDENLAVASRTRDISRAFELFPALAERRTTTAQMLSGGEQQMLVLARAVLSEPKVLLIDEMSQGLAPVIVKRLMPFVQTAAEAGIAVLLVEQFASLALSIGTYAYVLSVGRVMLEGSCRELLERPDDLRRAYLQGGSLSSGEDAEAPVAVLASKGES
jgi:branched-chain amino acid transport system ATP-binding protein